jgi:hydroxymethylbilane synthase
MSLPHEIRLGTRQSALALAQTDLFAASLLAAWPALQGRLHVLSMATTGDIIHDKPLYDIGGKALFCRELDQALLNNAIDLAVHSLKDVPAKLPDGLYLAAVLPRADYQDVLVSRHGTLLHHLPAGAVVGTSSPRRRAILAATFPHLLVRPIRGNVPTRLQLVEDGHVDAVILAYAGLQRLGLTARISSILAPEVMLPAATQGIIGIVCRTEDQQLRQLLGALNDQDTWQQALCERAFLELLNGSCRTPIGALATVLKDGSGDMTLQGLLAAPDGSKVFRAQLQGDSRVPANLGYAAAEQILKAAGTAFVTAMRG